MKLVTRRVVSQEIDNEETGTSARRSRMAESISLRDVAKQMGFSAPYISDLELGRRAWSTKLLADYTAAISKISMERKIARIQKAKGDALKKNLFIGGRK